MELLTCAIINGPCMILNILANSFFVFCMVCPLHGKGVKQPLKFLLGSMIFSTVIFLISSIPLFFWHNATCNIYFVGASCIVFAWSLTTSMSTSVWLNFFYCTQIVPAQRTPFTWIKKNIKPTIYCVWLLGNVFHIPVVGVMLFEILTLNNRVHHCFSNFTMHPDNVNVLIPSYQFNLRFYDVGRHFMDSLFLFFLCIMMMSSGSTVYYILAHIRQMMANGQPFSCPRFRSQVRVTVTGVLQGGLFLTCSVCALYKRLSDQISEGLLSLNDYFTVINLYMTASTFNLGVSQSVFRKKAEDIWLRATQS